MVCAVAYILMIRHLMLRPGAAYGLCRGSITMYITSSGHDCGLLGCMRILKWSTSEHGQTSGLGFRVVKGSTPRPPQKMIFSSEPDTLNSEV